MRIDCCSDCEYFKSENTLDYMCTLHNFNVSNLDDACVDFLTKLNG